MAMDLVNPYEELVIVGKRYKVAVPPQSSTVIRALTPTGRHVSHANKLGHWSGPHSGGRATRLERYTAKGQRGSGVLRVGKSLERGLGMLGRIPKVSKVPSAPKSALEDRLKNGPMKPANEIKKPSVFSLHTTSGKILAGTGATIGATGLGGYALGRTSKALAPVTPPAAVAPAMAGAVKPTKPLVPKAPMAARAPTSRLNSNMPAGARVGKRIPEDVEKREEWATYGRRAVQAMRGRGSSNPSAGEHKRGFQGRAKWMVGGVPESAAYAASRAKRALRDRRR